MFEPHMLDSVTVMLKLLRTMRTLQSPLLILASNNILMNLAEVSDEICLGVESLLAHLADAGLVVLVVVSPRPQQ